ncbi:GEVED domain-containing protein [Flammeovirga aprica]|uniref:T9SS type A sorting domain-containing protein n=1 Tax=Flammeovirga aprica JL-4 TaxID=694437 RepID=A0A7X9RV73_9BACT|nr:GEVED domain-containing protein [Flammeovirga aprica]NME69334.1 T9SS type A sorting domain-containing protein [Flammeovirga aprica JL-4]
MKSNYYNVKGFAFIAILFLNVLNTFAQGYNFSLEGGTWNGHGNISPNGGTMLVGGAEVGGDGEVNATQWFVDQADGGDYLVLRTDAVGGQASWVWSNFSNSISAAAELSITTKNGANNATVAQYIRDAEAVFIAGGDQREYMDLWKGTAVEDALNYLINVKNVPIGGTSAGMAIMGGAYYAPETSGILSSEILNNPYHPYTSNSLFYNDFINNPVLTNVITDTHLDRTHGTNNENRYGRAFGLLARTVADNNATARYAIACDEATFVCIDVNGMAKVFGDGGQTQYPTKAYFMVVNCAVPETITSGQSLVWNNNNAAVKAYVIQGSTNGNGNSFSLTDWTTASGGGWLDMYTSNGYNGFNYINGSGASIGATAPNCDGGTTPPICDIPTVAIGTTTASSIAVSWNNTGASSYQLRHRVTGTSSWTTMTVNTTNYSIQGLTSSTSYDIRVRSVCGTEQSNYSPIQTASTTGNISYCSSYGNSTRYEFIDEVGIDGVYNFSGNDNGYGNNTSVTFNLTKGNTHTLFVDPNTSDRERFVIWIDYNQDGIFDTNTEEIAYKSTRRSFTSNFTVPTSALSGITRMRVSMQYANDGYPNPCDVISYGEVEDYTVSISGGSSQRTQNFTTLAPNNALYPNPTEGIISIHSNAENIALKVVDMLGNTLIKVQTNSVDLSSLNAGIYMIQVEEDGVKSIHKVIKK